MIVDAHYHLEERLEPLDRLLGQMARHGIGRVALIAAMSDVFHAEGAAVRALLGLARRSLMSRFRAPGLLAYRTSVTKAGKLSILGRTYAIYARPDNDAVARAMAAHPDELCGWIFVNPAAHDPIAEIEARLGEPGWIGVKSHPFWHHYPVRLLDDTAAYCAGAGLPLLVHLGGDRESGDFRFLPERHPALRLLYAHAGVPFFRELWSHAQRWPRVVVDLSSPYLDEPLRVAAVAAMGPDRCLYGSDGPYGYPDGAGHYDHGAILREVERLPISAVERDRILGGNFLELVAR